MPKLPGIRHQDAVRVFEKLGYRIIRQSGHIVMSNGETRLIIPRANPVDPFTYGRNCPRCRADAGRIQETIVNLSGRGDKDVAQVADKVGLKMPK